MKKNSQIAFLSAYSFFLSILVIFVHSTHFTVPELQAVRKTAFFDSSNLLKLEFFFSEFLGQVAVPGFFFLSGFLFYRNLNSMKDWGRKLKERMKSYLIPYLLWNTGMTLLYMFFQKAECNPENLFQGILFYRFNPVFWYFYQLLLLTFCFPFIAVSTLLGRGRKKQGRIAFIFPFLFLILVYFRLDIPYLNEDAGFYYSFGAAFSIFLNEEGESNIFLRERRTRNTYLKRFILPCLLFCFSLFCYGYVLFGENIAFLLSLTVLYRLSMAMFFFCIFWLRGDRPTLSCKGNRGLAYFFEALQEMNFYIYAVHYLFLRLWFMLQSTLQGLLQNVLPLSFYDGVSNGLKAFFYLLSPVYCLALAYFTGVLIKRISPNLWKTINGGRG